MDLISLASEVQTLLSDGMSLVIFRQSMIVRKQVEKASQLFRKETKPYRLNILNSPLSEEITSCRFLKKFVIPNFEHYLGVTDLIQHFCQYQDKMVVHSHDDALLSCLFPSSLKGAAYDWLYSLPSKSLQDFEDVK